MYAILSDIHGNMFALEQVVRDMSRFDIEGVILLGDLIDYGMQSNEVVSYLRDDFNYDVICNIWGNHEQSIMEGDYSRFSSQRGVECARHTASLLTDETRRYLSDNMDHSGMSEFVIAGRKCLAVHASAEDKYWRAIAPDNLRGEYGSYDIVFSGHSHYSHFFTKFYEADDPARRNKHAVTFINPGSVGQPRNHNNNAQYALLDTDTMSVFMRAVAYDIDQAASLYDGSVDGFYKDRLFTGV